MLKKRLKDAHYKVRVLQIWCDCRTGSIPIDIDNVFDFTLTSDSSGGYYLENDRLFHNGALVGFRFLVDDKNSYENLRNKIGLVEWIVLDFSNWKMIPVENAISECEGTGTKIAVIVTEGKDVNGIAFALEKGVDAIIIKPEEELIRASCIAKSQRLENKTQNEQGEVKNLGNMMLTEATITNIETGGIGERYCIDLALLNI